MRATKTAIAEALRTDAAVSELVPATHRFLRSNAPRVARLCHPSRWSASILSASETGRWSGTR